MKTATITELKKELKYYEKEDLMQLCLRLAKFKKDNKDLLTYLIFEANNEEQYIRSIQEWMLKQFEAINVKSFYYTKKSCRKILRDLRKYIRYSSKKATEVELLLFYCTQLKKIRPSIFKSVQLGNLYERQILNIQKAIAKLHEDLQFDYEEELDYLESL